MVEPTAADIVAALPHAALLADARADIAALNAAARALFPQASVGDPVAFALRDPRMLEALQAARSGRTGTAELTDRLPAGRTFAVHAAPAGNGFALIVLEDLTKQRAHERMRVDFIANASHELRTPLASLLGFLETLRGAARDDAAARDRFLGIMDDQARRMARLVDDLLSLSRIEMLAHQQPMEVVVLGDAASEIADALRGRAAGADMTIAIMPSDRPLRVRGDRDELLRALENLVENAVRYGAQGKRVEITLKAEGGMAVASVRDFGPGIAAEHLPRLTERFYRADAAASRQSGGTGLGLAIVKHIMLRHRGSLVIDSAPGQGSTFALRLPLID